MNQTLLWLLVLAGFYIYLKNTFTNVQKNQIIDDNKRGFDPKNYELRQTLMSLSERLFFEKLRHAVGDRYDIYPQVNLDKIFKTKYQDNKYSFNGAKWAIDRRSVDFLITIRETQRPFIGIELDDSSHEREDRIVRDEKVNALFKENGIDLIRFNTTDNFLEEELKKVFDRHY